MSPINSMFLEPSIGTCPLARRCQTAASQSSRSRHHHHGRLTWTEPVKYWRKACLLACLDHTVLLQIMAKSHTLHSIIVLADDPRWKRRPKANSSSNLSPAIDLLPKGLLRLLVGTRQSVTALQRHEGPDVT
ncbi:hypothetical protein G7Y89_g10556 [Cudoniella acicularis]|uniref:Uncharacterized protein n=1 Tax=Cudoniella acicularis TaxID=354080 RepID=A0A8H4W1H8_9HELO|nr:hypothetical protein G7Y89_g10556 [Cudoniella acicularis]